ncbi:hypothetical protein HUK49_04930 [Limosilactobacillus sp. c11Ua_112_M]|uniref:hypothetical protein n=1 Tax=Limosilactobacillus TaxID=2742598 RepID=UPI0017867330|nr:MULTISPECIES: hypothetical protein [Limosilactobacillus]MBD8087300.1 hypothetical protein [Limosilactobacillus portuensis]MEC4741780.1 hypothetical protein [Limosilactobacillus sp. c10Ua_36]
MTQNSMIRLNATNAEKVDQLFAFLKNNTYLMDENVRTKSGLANQLLGDYLSILIQKWSDDPKLMYSDFKKLLINKKVADRNKEVIKLERGNRDLLNMIFYLLMDTNQSMIRRDMRSYEKLDSMFHAGNAQNEIYAALANLVKQDNQELFKKLSKNGKGLL